MASGGKEPKHKMSDDKMQYTGGRKTEPCYEHLKAEIEKLKKVILHLEAHHGKATAAQESKINELTMKIVSLRNQLELTTSTEAATSLQPSTSLQPTVLPSWTGAGEGPTMTSNSQTQGNSDNYPADVSIQESLAVSSSTGGASLTNIPTNPIERSLYNNYELLLLAISDQLLSMDVNKFKTWASREFGTDPHSVDIKLVFRDLDQKKVIGPLNLRKLREFFEMIQRIDLVYLIDHFLLSDYGPLRDMNSRRDLRNNSQTIDRGLRAANGQRTLSVPPSQYPITANNERRPPEQTHSVRPQGSLGKNPSQAARVALAERESLTSLDNQYNDDDDDNQPWLCKHYKRRCNVKFTCCDKYWPCHRCHNKESNCGQKKLRSRDTTFVKCVRCGTEEQFSATSQFCSKCSLKFANYFCVICKHLSGTDDIPYHCEKCGICRIHKHRSFHCDTCGVCLDVQLQDNHNCRKGTVRDKCCICLEDAFTGCQILPCSHKVHKECAARMIRSRMSNNRIRCQLCPESQPESDGKHCQHNRHG